MVLSFALREHIMDTTLFECKPKIKLLSTVTNCVVSFSIAGTSLQCLQKKMRGTPVEAPVLVPSAGQTLQKSVNLVFSFTLGMQGTLR